MHLAKLVFSLCTSSLVALAAPGCTVSVEGPSGAPPTVEPATTGSLTVRWNVAGTASRAACAGYRASTLELVVYAPSGRRFTTANAACESFALSVTLPEGTYTADATLLDARGSAVTTTKTLEAIEVIAGTDLAIDLDFPAASLL